MKIVLHLIFIDSILNNKGRRKGKGDFKNMTYKYVDKAVYFCVLLQRRCRAKYIILVEGFGDEAAYVVCCHGNETGCILCSHGDEADVKALSTVGACMECLDRELLLLMRLCQTFPSLRCNKILRVIFYRQFNLCIG